MAERDELRKGTPDEFGTLEPLQGRPVRAGGAHPSAFAPLRPVEGRPPEISPAPRRAGVVGALLGVGFLSTLIGLLLVVNQALPPPVLETPSSLPSAGPVPEVNAVAEPAGEPSLEPVEERTAGPTGSVAVGPAPRFPGTPTSGSDRGTLRPEDGVIRDENPGPGGGGGNGGDDTGAGDGGGSPGRPDGGVGLDDEDGKGKDKGKDHGEGHENGHGHGDGRPRDTRTATRGAAPAGTSTTARRTDRGRATATSRGRATATTRIVARATRRTTTRG
ncbi:MAG TPA: hypothetical protein VJ868_05180 [Actinomycetota bacterium]|nr:hypothetical protein [Actinomycetota bacterium]